MSYNRIGYWFTDYPLASQEAVTTVCVSCFFSEVSTRLPAFIPWTLFSLGLFFQLPLHSVSAQEGRESLPNEALAQSLAEKWKLQREDLSLVEIGYRSIRRMVPIGHDIGRDAVSKLIRRLVRSSEPKTLGEVAIALDPRLKGIQPAWANGIFLMDGESFLSEELFPGRVDMPFTVVRHGGYELHARFSNRDHVQVDVMWEQTKHKFGPQGLSDFVVMPPDKFLNTAQIAKIQVKGEEDRLSISKESLEFIVSSKTGFVHEARRGEFGNGKYIETIQFRPQKHGKTIVMPELYFQGRYSGNRLSSFSLSLIDKVTTSPNGISKNFQVAVLPGDYVIDHTGVALEMIMFTQPANDALSLVLDPELERLPLKSKR